MCANPQSNTIAVRASYILPFLRRFPRWKSRKTRGVVYLPSEKTKTETTCLFEFWGRPFYLFWGDFRGENQEKPGGWSISPRKKPKQKPHVFLSFGGDPLNLQSFIEISEMVCSTTAQCSRGHTLKSQQCSTSVVVMVWFCHATCVSNISLRDKTCSQLLYSHELYYLFNN